MFLFAYLDIPPPIPSTAAPGRVRRLPLFPPSLPPSLPLFLCLPFAHSPYHAQHTTQLQVAGEERDDNQGKEGEDGTTDTDVARMWTSSSRWCRITPATKATTTAGVWYVFPSLPPSPPTSPTF